MTRFDSLLHRRRFLQQCGIGAAALGSGTLPNLLAYPATSWTRKSLAPRRIIIIGAGLAGLAAGLELKAAGHEVVILEGRTRPGGRVYTLRHPFSDGLHAEGGAVIYASNYTVANKYIDQFGLQRLDYDVPNLKPHYFLDGRHIVLDGSALQWPYGVTEEENKLGPFGIIKKYLLDTLPTQISDYDSWSSSPVLKDLDQLTLGAYMRRHGASPGALELIKQTQYFGSTIDQGSALSSLVADLFFFFTGAKFFLLDGGNDRLPMAMADRLREEIHYGLRVAAVDQRGDKVRVTAYRGGRMETIEGDRAICTLPAPVLRSIDFSPALDQAKSNAINSISYLDTTRTYVQVKQAFWVNDGIAGSAFTDLPVQDITRQPYSMKIDASKRAIMESHVRGSQAKRHAAMDKSELIDFTVKQISKVFPDLPRYREGGHVKAWSRDPFSLSAYSWPRLGEVSAYLQDLQRPHGKVHFAGEHTSILRALMEGALRSGVRAAREVNDAD